MVGVMFIAGFFPGIMLADFIAGLALPRSMILPGIILICVIWGCVMDGDAIMIFTVPIIFPVVQAPEFDPI